MSAYIVTAGYVTVQTAVPGGRAQVDIPRGSVLPDDVPDEQVETLLRLGHIAVRVEPDPAPDGPVVDVAGDGVPDGSAKDVLAWVDGDPERATAAWDAEQARDKPRATLLADLTKLVG